MTEKTILLELLKEAENADLQELFEQSIHNEDEEKRQVYDVLYHYVLGKRQEEIINRKDFVR